MVNFTEVAQLVFAPMAFLYIPLHKKQSLTELILQFHLWLLQPLHAHEKVCERHASKMIATCKKPMPLASPFWISTEGSSCYAQPSQVMF